MTIETMLDSGVPDELPKPPPAAATRLTVENVITVRHWTPKLVSFQTSRAPGFRFTSGHYTRVGLGGADGNLVWRPFSVVSAAYDPYLESAAGISLDPRRSRIMVCGNPELGHALRWQLTARDFHVNWRATPGQLAFENYWQGTPA